MFIHLGLLKTCLAFIILDNTNYTDVDIGHGSIKTNFVPARFCEPLTYDKSTHKVKLPMKEDWQALINQCDPTPAESSGYLVLDCEKLYLNGDTSSIETNLSYLKQLQLWAREIRPNRILGWYGVSNYANSSPENIFETIEALAELIDFEGPDKSAYFPSAYTNNNGNTPYLKNRSWKEGVQLDYEFIMKVESITETGTHQKIPYIWPQYYNSPQILIPASRWTDILTTLDRIGYTGAIIWGGQNELERFNSENGGYGPWVKETQQFLDELY